MTSFAPGDRVRLNVPGWSSYRGRTGTIVRYEEPPEPGGYHVFVCVDQMPSNMNHAWFLGSELELMTEEPICNLRKLGLERPTLKTPADRVDHANMLALNGLISEETRCELLGLPHPDTARASSETGPESACQEKS